MLKSIRIVTLAMVFGLGLPAVQVNAAACHDHGSHGTFSLTNSLQLAALSFAIAPFFTVWKEWATPILRKRLLKKTATKSTTVATEEDDHGCDCDCDHGGCDPF
jgi:hypothetical protein